MIRKTICVFFMVICLMVASGCGIGDGSVKVSLAELYGNPATYNHKLIKISGVILHGFEQFTLTDPSCPRHYAVWLDYGGTFASDYERKKSFTENFSIPLVRDETFRKFDELIQPKSEVSVRATVIGRFFAGERDEGQQTGNIYWRGYGHLGCCSLLVIQQIVSIDQ